MPTRPSDTQVILVQRLLPQMLPAAQLLEQVVLAPQALLIVPRTPLPRVGAGQ